MAEYSRMASGSFTSSASLVQPVYLPFLPDQVEVWNLTGIDHAATGLPAYAMWNQFMAAGDASGWQTASFATTPGVSALVGMNYSPGGITPFSAGLSFQFGVHEAISSITKANPAVVTTSSAHGYNTGDVVMFESIAGMNQIAGIPFAITVTGSTTFTIPWNTNQAVYTAATGGFVTKILYPFLYAPGISVINNIGLGATTLITTTAPHNLVVGQEVAFRIPAIWGCPQLNSLPNPLIPGSPIYGYVTIVNSTTQVTVNINSLNFTNFTTSIPTSAIPGLSFAQIVAVGDINNGGRSYNGGNLYPAPLVNSVATINGPAIQGAFVDNTRYGFTIGSSIITAASQNIYWEASLHDYSRGTVFSANP